MGEARIHNPFPILCLDPKLTNPVQPTAGAVHDEGAQHQGIMCVQ